MEHIEFVDMVTKVLYESDPAGTFCNENDLFNEYEIEAEMIALRVIKQNRKLLESLMEVFDKQFDGHYNTHKLLSAKKSIEEKTKLV